MKRFPVSTMQPLRPTLSIQTVYIHPGDRETAVRLGADLYQILTRPVDDPLSFGPCIPVLSGVALDHVDTNAADRVVLIPVLGKLAFLEGRELVLQTLSAWSQEPGRLQILPLPVAEVWRTSEDELPVKQLLTELYGEKPRHPKTVDEILLAVTRLLDPDAASASLFISHAKKDLISTENAAKAIHDHVATDLTGKAFFDSVDLVPGKALEGQIVDAIRGVLISVRTDSYSSRIWCQRELLRAKSLGLPTLTVEFLEEGELRASPYAGNVPSIVWRDNPQEIASRAMVEWLRSIYFQSEAVRLRKTADYPDSTYVLARAPELLDVAQGPLSAHVPQIVIHPDPELSVPERQILKGANARLVPVTPTTAYRRLLARESSSVSFASSEHPGVGIPRRQSGRGWAERLYQSSPD